MNQKEAANQQFNREAVEEIRYYYKIVKESFSNSSVTELTNKLMDITAKQKGDPNTPLTKEEFKLLGDFAYIIGMDMTGTKKKFLKQAVVHFRQRFEDCNEKFMNKGFANALKDAFEVMNEAKLRPVMDELKSNILQPIKEAKPGEGNNLRLAFKKAFKTFIIPVNICKDVNDILTKVELITYQDILKLNTLIYGAGDFSKGSIKYVSELYGEFRHQMIAADECMNQQKYAFIRFESILSVCEMLKVHPDAFDFLYDNEKYEKYEYAESEQHEANEKKEEVKTEKKEESAEEENKPAFSEKFHKKTPEEVNEIYNNKPDFYIRSMIEESLEKPVENLDDFIKGYDLLISNDDILSSIYTYMVQASQKQDRPSFDETWENLFTEEQFVARINMHIESKKSSYKESVEKMTKDIPEENIDRIITYVNDCIMSLVISGAKEKGYLLTQVNENQIKTWSHLREIISIIDAQKINGSNIDTYATLYNYLTAQTEYTELILDITKHERNTNYLALYNRVKDFYAPKKQENAEDEDKKR